MKKTFTKISIALGLAATFAACAKFDKINTNPMTATDDQVQVEYLLNNSIIGAQQDPHIAERTFVNTWKTTARQHLATGIAAGSYSDETNNDYWRYSANWLAHANKAIEIGNMKAADGTAEAYNENLIQVSRIWRAYLMSELSDNFGSIPIAGFQAVNPEFNSTKDVYYFLLEELKDAASKIDVSVLRTDKLEKLDPAYAYQWENWIRYANSMRMRLAMRMADVDPEKAKSAFESAVATNKLIIADDQTFQVAETAGWHDLVGVMSREWNYQVLSATLNNLYVGLGGIPSKEQLNDSLHTSIKPENYAGKRMLGHYSTLTNDPGAGFFFDGLPNSIDPRAYMAFFIPGNKTSPQYSNYPAYAKEPGVTKINFIPAEGYNKDTLKVDVKNTWSSMAIGDFGKKGTGNGIRAIQIGKIPGLAQKFRNSSNKRIFFANWETYFLLAEASVRGWNTGTTAQAAYENGVKANFEYMGVAKFVNQYLTSTDYNRVGTSVSFTHVTEPGQAKNMTYIDGYTGESGTLAIPYPVNTIYKNGTVKNDLLTKIITQKYIANMPWLPLEAWNDHRRLGLPFFENPAIENPLTNLPALTTGNYMTNAVNFFPQRLQYPSNFRTVDVQRYSQAVSLLGGPDDVFTPLWWAKQK